MAGRMLGVVAVLGAVLCLAGCGPADSTARAQSPKPGEAKEDGAKDGAAKGEGAKDGGVKAHPTVSETTPEDQRKLPKLRAVNVHPELIFHKPLWVGTAPDKGKRLFVVEQSGKIKVFADSPDTKPEGVKVFLDLSDKVYMGHNEEGLLALAFHPKFAKNRFIYVYYSVKGDEADGDGEGRRRAVTRYGVISRFTVDKNDADKAVRDSEVEILRLKQPWGNHNGGDLVFGPDGFLYFSFGDGGAGGDPLNSGQDLSSLLGKMLRLDVDKEENGKKYGIPKDNPFVGKNGVLPEIWAYGLRNVWRMSFDSKTGELWGGDVGQNAWEEIDIITKGGNFGWRIREGAHQYEKGKEDAPGLIDPVVEYRQSRANGRSVTGGFVYREKHIKGLEGAYVFADYESGRVWGVTRDATGKVTEYSVLCDSGRRISSFGFGTKGEFLFCNHLTNGRLVKLELDDGKAVEE